MAEMSRCGRRKQRNPRRKNGDEETTVTPSLHLNNDLHLKGDLDNDPEGDCAQMDTETDTQPDTDSVHDDRAPSDGCNDHSDSDVPQSSSPVTVTPTTEIQDALSPKSAVTTETDKPKVALDPSPVCHNKQPDKSLTEEDKIQELLNRSDTAVIFPEPVSDHDDDPSNPPDDPEDEGAGERDYMLRCSHCDKGFTRIYLLREHLRTTHRDKVHKHACPKCEESFELKTQLDKHLSFHSPTSQICSICNKTFANVYRLQRHMISHDESTDLRKFKCPECGKAFKFKHHLKEHIRIHSGEKPFECTNCGKRFSHSGSYSSHMTSKKCWVVNMRMKKSEKPGEERTANGDDSNILRPLAPKGDDNGVDLSVQSLYTNQFTSQFLPIDATTAQYIAAAQAQLNGTRPFLPYPGPYPGHMINPLIPGLTGSPYGYALVPDKKEQITKDLDEKHEFSGPKSMKLSTVPVKEEQEADENQNTQTTPTSEKDSCSEVKEEPVTVKAEGGEDEEGSRHDDSGTTDGGDEAKSKESSDSDTSIQPTKTCNMKAIKEVLQILDATVTQQKMQKDDKTSISKLASQTGESEKESLERKEDSVSEGEAVNGDLLPCRFCKESFQSPVEHHQHERYLCKQNVDIQPKESQSLLQVPNDQSNHSTDGSVANSNNNGTTSPSLSQTETEKGSEDETGTGHSDADTFMDKEGRQYRVRSMLTDEQQRILKAHYAINPRPNKFDLLQIAGAVNFPKRVVQVWFQNMRARDRRRGNPVPAAAPPGGSIGDKLSNGTSWSPPGGSTKATPTTTPYIPVVPQFPSNGVVHCGPSVVFNQYTCPPTSKANGQMPTPHRGSPSPANLTFTMQVEPLDLSTKKPTPTQAHSSKPFTPVNHIDQLEEGEVLNLSKRSTSSLKPLGEAQPLENSAIYKYMQQEGMITNGSSDGGTHSNRSTPSLHPPLVRPSGGAHTPLPGAYSRATPEPLPPSQTVFPVPTSTPNHSSPLLMRASPILPPLGSPSLCTSPPSSLDSSFNSTLSLDSAGLENGLKAKRARRKSWRQMESEQLDYDDSLMIDEDGVSRSKKRKSWKAHKVDMEEGMYACDQCDKLFSKQSSLARHKYEHSGARPFSCDECGKAFKHKHHLTEHRRLHSGEKPFVCGKCGKRFSHSGSFSQHMNHRYKYCKPLRGGSTNGNDSGSENGSENCSEN